jgi:hypothetical protein
MAEKALVTFKIAAIEVCEIFLYSPKEKTFLPSFQSLSKPLMVSCFTNSLFLKTSLSQKNPEEGIQTLIQ